jgi:ActR/RegA family two-component response regulator
MLDQTLASRPADPPSALPTPVPTEAPVAAAWPSLDELSMIYIHRVLEQAGGNKTKAALTLGMARRTLERILARARKGRSPAMHTRV